MWLDEWFPENETNLCSSSHFPLRSSCRHLEGNLRQVTSEFSPLGSDMATMLEGGTSVKAQGNGVPESLSGLTMLRLGCALTALCSIAVLPSGGILLRRQRSQNMQEKGTLIQCWWDVKCCSMEDSMEIPWGSQNRSTI